MAWILAGSFGNMRATRTQQATLSTRLPVIRGMNAAVKMELPHGKGGFGDETRWMPPGAKAESAEGDPSVSPIIRKGTVPGDGLNPREVRPATRSSRPGALQQRQQRRRPCRRLRGVTCEPAESSPSPLHMPSPKHRTTIPPDLTYLSHALLCRHDSSPSPTAQIR